VSDLLRLAVLIAVLVDPISAAVGASALAAGRGPRARAVIVGAGAAVAAAVLGALALSADPVLDWLDISPGAAQLAAGIVVLLPALDLLFQGPGGRVRADERVPVWRLALFPYGVPLLAGPGAAAAVIAWAASEGTGVTLPAALLACAGVAVVAFAWRAPVEGRAVRALGGFAAVAAAIIAFDLVRDGVFGT
jgi:multiple antibiotic resistance protein